MIFQSFWVGTWYPFSHYVVAPKRIINIKAAVFTFLKYDEINLKNVFLIRQIDFCRIVFYIFLHFSWCQKKIIIIIAFDLIFHTNIELCSRLYILARINKEVLLTLLQNNLFLYVYAHVFDRVSKYDNRKLHEVEIKIKRIEKVSFQD